MATHLRTPPPRRLRLALGVVKVVTIAALLAVFTGAWVTEHAAGPASDLGPADSTLSLVEQAMRANRCSSTGFGAAEQPEGALVRTPGGQLRAVTFDEGWAVFTRDRPGTLVAVCLDPPRAPGR